MAIRDFSNPKSTAHVSSPSKWSLQFSSEKTWLNSALVAEAEAARMAATWGGVEEWSSVILEGDSQVVVNAITDLSCSPHSSITQLIKDVRSIFSSNLGWRASFSGRSSTRAAHEMAQWAFRLNFSGTLLCDQLPHSVQIAASSKISSLI
ncbi:hypothetical protein Vadar_004458 [Vaccinium darrowii]|uniref:Uncharacterized protein n=1 Tax=Vaccinium darrowii TaxID=229202 RepID=A0ACB7XFW7_9ERIC|nr:hypothetical protein Vadar_004458 [Vaccinium darrowii]